MKHKSPSKPKTINDYLAGVRPDKRRTLQKLRKDIQAAVPKAEACINYEIPGFRLNGKYLVGFGAAAHHCAFYLGSTVQKFKTELKKYDTSKGTIRFQPDDPLPAPLVRKLIKARTSEKGL